EEGRQPVHWTWWEGLCSCHPLVSSIVRCQGFTECEDRACRHAAVLLKVSCSLVLFHFRLPRCNFTCRGFFFRIPRRGLCVSHVNGRLIAKPCKADVANRPWRERRDFNDGGLGHRATGCGHQQGFQSMQKAVPGW